VIHLFPKRFIYLFCNAKVKIKFYKKKYSIKISIKKRFFWVVIFFLLVLEHVFLTIIAAKSDVFPKNSCKSLCHISVIYKSIWHSL